MFSNPMQWVSAKYAVGGPGFGWKGHFYTRHSRRCPIAPRWHNVPASMTITVKQLPGQTVTRESTCQLPSYYKVDRPRLSQAYVDDLENGTGKQLLISDAELSGFCLRVRPSGRKIYCVCFRVSGRVRHYTIGAAGSPWTADEARVKAREIMLAVSWRRDPATEKQQTFGGMTVSLLIQRYLSDGPATRLEKRAPRLEVGWAIEPFL